MSFNPAKFSKLSTKVDGRSQRPRSNPRSFISKQKNGYLQGSAEWLSFARTQVSKETHEIDSVAFRLMKIGQCTKGNRISIPLMSSKHKELWRIHRLRQAGNSLK